MSNQIERIEDVLGETPSRGAPTGFAAPEWGGGDTDALSRRAAVIALALLSGLALGVFGLLVAGGPNREEAPLWLLVAAVGVAGLTLIYKKFELGIVVFIGVCWIAVGTPSVATGGGGSGQRLLVSQLGLAVLLLVWLTRMIVRQDFKLYPTPINRPIVVFLAFCAWSTVNGLLLRDPNVVEESYTQYWQVNVFEMSVRILCLVGIVMIGNTLRGRELRWAALAVLVPGIATFTGALPFLRSTAYFAFPQIVAMALLAGLVITGQGARWLRILGGALALAILVVYAIKGASWISGWLGAFTSLGLILFIRQRRLFYTGCVVVAFLVLLNWPVVYQKVYVENFESVSADRFTMLRGAVLYASHFPLGIGLGNYRAYQVYYGHRERWNTTAYSSAHGTYAQSLSETGWIGLILLLYLLFVIGRMLYRYYQALPEGFAKSYTLGALGGFVGISAASFAGDYLFPAYHNGGVGSFGSTVYTFLMIGVVVAMAREHGIVLGETRERARAVEPVRVAPIYNRGPYRNTAPGARGGAGQEG